MKPSHGRRRTAITLLILLLAYASDGPARGGGPQHGPCELVTEKKTADDLRAAARAALGADALWTTVFAPVLPARWPAAGGGAVLLVYRSEALPTGIVRYRIRGPSIEVRSAAFGAPPQLRQLGTGKVLGNEEPRERPATAPSRLIEAEHVLLDMLCGGRNLDTARAAMEPYRDWLRLHPVIAKDLERRAPGFFAWLNGQGT